MKIFISLAVFALFIYVFIRLSKSRVPALALYYSSFDKKVREGEPRETACRYALMRISHRPPINALTGAEIDRLVAVFSKFKDQVDVSVLLKEALINERIDILREPYVTRLEAAGREKGLLL